MARLSTIVDRRVDAFADRDRLLQVVLNLVTNAIKYSPAGGIVRVSAEERAGIVTLAVTDEGLGIPEDELPKLPVAALRGMLKTPRPPVTIEEMDEAIASGAAETALRRKRR